MRTLLVIMAGFGVAAVQAAQPNRPAVAQLSPDLRAAYRQISRAVVAAAEKMPAEHYAFRPSIERIGSCETVNCGRLFPQSQFNLRVSKRFRVTGRMRVEAIGEVFNLFNALNPSNGRATNRRVTIPAGAKAGRQDPTLLQPTSFSGDFQRPEQRLGQIGFRFTF